MFFLFFLCFSLFHFFIPLFSFCFPFKTCFFLFHFVSLFSFLGCSKSVAALQDSLGKSAHSELALFALYWFVVTFPCGKVHILRTRIARLVPSMRRLTHLSLLSSLFSCLVFFSFVSSSVCLGLGLGLGLCLCLSLSVSLSPCGVCGRVVVVGCGCGVRCEVCGVVCDTLKKTCGPAPRVHVLSTCACGAGIHGDVLNVHMGTVEWTHGGRRGRGRCARSAGTHGDVLSLVKPSVFFDILEHLYGMLGSSLIVNFLLTISLPTYGYHVLQRFNKETLGSYIY